MFETKIKEVISRINENCFITSDDHFSHKAIFDFQPHRKDLMIKDGVGVEGLWPDQLLKAHDDWMVKKFNSVVGEDDTTIFLGDFAFKNLDIAKRLNGYKILILGNHDRKGPQVYDQAGFDYVIRGLLIQEGDKVFSVEATDKLFSALVKEINGYRVLFGHYPPDEREFRYYKDDLGESDPNKPSIMNARISELINVYYDMSCDFALHGHTHDKHPVMETINLINVCRDTNSMKPYKLGDIFTLNKKGAAWIK